MNSIQNTLQFIVDNWSQIVIILTLILTIYTKTKNFIIEWDKKTEEERKKAEKEATDYAIKTAKSALADCILVMVSRAELDWNSVDGKLGQTKRAQVIEEIYDKYPVLEEVEDKEELAKYIDELINKALDTVKKELGK